VLVETASTNPTTGLLPVGEVLALPVRLLGRAATGEIVVSPAVGRLVEGWFALRAREGGLGTEAYLVVGLKARPSPLQMRSQRPLSQFVGRARELATLDDLLEQATGGRGQVAGLVGEPGVGKSRLLYEFQQRLTGHPVTYLEGHCLRETPQLFPTLWGLWRFYNARGVLLTARELGEQLIRLAEREAEPMHCMEAHAALGQTLLSLGEYIAARTHLEQGIALTDQTTQRAHMLRNGEAPAVRCMGVAAETLWCLGYPAQAVRRGQEALALVQALDHPYSLATAEFYAIYLHHYRREIPALQVQADALLTLATAQQFPQWVAHGAFWQGWVLAVQGQGAAGMGQMHQGLAAILATGQRVARPRYLILLAEAAGHAGQVAEGLRLLAETWAMLEESGQGNLLAEAHRVQGELLQQQAVPNVAQAEACFQQALVIARRQQAKSWELRAAMSLSRLWQQQGKRHEARQLLAEVHSWFTEGFDTADLQDARALLEVLSG